MDSDFRKGTDREVVGHNCVDPETAAAYLDGTLSEADRNVLENHLAGCDDCREFVAGAFSTGSAVGVLGPPTAAGVRRQSRWTVPVLIGAAAALVIAIVRPDTLGLRRPLPSGEVSDLVRALGARRPIEGRLAGGFLHGAQIGRVRSGENGPVADPEVVIAAARLEQALERRRSATTLGAFASGQLVIGDVDRAISSFQEAAALAPADPSVWIGLSAAYIERWHRVSGQRAEEALADAVAAAVRATQLAPGAPEAWFNLALAHERRGDTASAASAWEAFLRVEDDPAWSGEGRQRRSALTRSPR